MVEFRPSLQIPLTTECLILPPGTAPGEVVDKIRLEMKDELQRCTSSFFISVSCQSGANCHRLLSDNMQTKSAKKRDLDNNSQVSQSLYNG